MRKKISLNKRMKKYERDERYRKEEYTQERYSPSPVGCQSQRYISRVFIMSFSYTVSWFFI